MESGGSTIMFKHLCALASTSAICVIIGGQASAADLGGQAPAPDPEEYTQQSKPAVSGLNAKLDIQYNYLDYSTIDGHVDSPSVIGTITLPVGHSFGLQIDAGITQYEGSSLPVSITMAAGAGHLFWRDPDLALFGLYAHYANVSYSGGGSSVGLWRFGAEAELFLDRVSIEGFAGADISDLSTGNLDYFNGNMKVAFYATENFRIHGGVMHQFDQTFGRVGGEAMLPFGSNNIAVYADGVFGGDVDSVRGGIRIYFGESGKSLMARHREDDPQTQLDAFAAIGWGTASGVIASPGIVCAGDEISDGNGGCIADDEVEE